MLCVQGDSTVLKEKVAHCHLKRLELLGGRNLLPFLSGAKDNCSITDLAVTGEPIYHYMPTCNYTIPCTCTIGSVHVWVGPFAVTQIVLIWPTLKCEVVFHLDCKTNLSLTWHMYFGSPMECKSGLASHPLSPVHRTGTQLVAIIDLKVCLMSQ